MKPKTAVILTVLLLICVGFVIVRNSKLLTPAPKAQAPAAAPLLANAPADVRKLIIAPADGNAIAFSRQDDEWRIDQPIVAKAVSSSVSSLISTLKELKYLNAFAPGDKDAVGPAVTGLDKPRWTVEMQGPAGQSVKLLVGKSKPLTRGLFYVGIGGDPRTFVIGTDLGEELSRPVQNYRQKTVLKFEAANASQLRLWGKEIRGVFEMEKVMGEWDVSSPFHGKADKDAVKQIVDQLASVAAVDFVSEPVANLAAYGLQEGKERLAVRVTVTPPQPATAPTSAPASEPATESSISASPRPRVSASSSSPATAPAAPPKVYTLVLGDRTDDKIYAKLADDPAVFQLNASLADEIQKHLEALRPKNVMEVEEPALSAIDITTQTGQVSLLKEDGLWKMVKPTPGKANQRQVSALLGAVSGLKAENWTDDKAVPPAVSGLQSPQAKIVLHYAGRSITPELIVGASARGADVTYVQTAAKAAIAVVKTFDVQPLLESAFAYYDAHLLAMPAHMRPTRLEVKRPDGSVALVRGSQAEPTAATAPQSRPAGEKETDWRLTAPVAAPADQRQVETALRSLAKLDAAKVAFVGETIPEKYAKAAQSLTVALWAQEESPAQPSSQPSSAPASGPASAPASEPATVPSSISASPRPRVSASSSSSASQPASAPAQKVLELQVALVDGMAYAWLPGQKTTTIGEFPAALYENLAGEFRDRKIWELPVAEVNGIGIVAGETRVELRREGADWVNAQNPDEKVDAKNVQAYLNDLRDLSAVRFVSYRDDPNGMAADDLVKPWLTVELRLEKGAPLRLSVSSKGQDPVGKYAAGGQVPGIFLLSPGSIVKLDKTMADFKAKPAAPAQSEYPGGMGQPPPE